LGTCNGKIISGAILDIMKIVEKKKLITFKRGSELISKNFSTDDLVIPML
jgi:hypothetical protein